MSPPKDMSLRDWFAGVALNGLLSCIAQASNVSAATMGMEGICAAAYELADAMLVERDAGQ